MPLWDGDFRDPDILALEAAAKRVGVLQAPSPWSVTGYDLGEPARAIATTVAEAAVVAVEHPKWQQRPLAVVVLKEGNRTTAEELLEYRAPRFPKSWLPDAAVLVREIPRTSAGEFLKRALREQFHSYPMARGS